MGEVFTVVLERVKALVAEQFDVEEDALGAETAFEELGAEPEDVVDFLLALDDEFDIDLSDIQPDRIVTIGDAVTVVKEVLGQ
ncbi:phosphopantetheine-binding protein [Ethanoligenens sp.]|uniref:phosphopantetheine-binding protein n=1 Tax=Ethanoligenens sp. TaxID=2099655 RepID=UPI0039EA7A30